MAIRIGSRHMHHHLVGDRTVKGREPKQRHGWKWKEKYTPKRLITISDENETNETKRDRKRNIKIIVQPSLHTIHNPQSIPNSKMLTRMWVCVTSMRWRNVGISFYCIFITFSMSAQRVAPLPSSPTTNAVALICIDCNINKSKQTSFATQNV